MKVRSIVGSFIAGALMMLAVNSSAAVFKIATVSPDGTSWMKSMRSAAADITVQTDGRVKFKFYPGGVMGNDKAVMRKIRIGQLQGAAVPGGAMAGVAPDSLIYTLPLKFKSFAEIDYVRQRMDSQIVAGIERGGFVNFGLAEGGFAYVMAKRPIASVKELKKGKVWIPSGDKAALDAVQTFGVSPVPLSLADVLAGLQTGLIDTAATSPIGAIALQWHTQISHMTDLPIMYFYALLAIDQKVFKRLSDGDQQIVRTIMTQAYEDIDAQNRKDNESAYDALLKQGIKLVTPSADEVAVWYSKADMAQEKAVVGGFFTPAIADQLDQHLQDYRLQSSAQE
ncbi:MAG: TRAP-type C4-dicarboxylate transport system substrate-binding protein [Porticoccus sp.]|jgi:TRAP-type C4-dicarboxylate transport system substrate-binding protein